MRLVERTAQFLREGVRRVRRDEVRFGAEIAHAVQILPV